MKPLKTVKKTTQILPKHLDLRPNRLKNGHMPRPRKGDTVLHEEPGFRVWKEKSQKGGWVTAQFRNTDGTTVTTKVRPSLVKQSLDYQASIEGRRFYGATVVRDMPTSFKHIWYKTDSPVVRLYKTTSIGVGWAKMLKANGLKREYKTLVSALKTRDPSLIENTVQSISDEFTNTQIQELFNYENTIENGLFDDYLMMEE